jgi:hypothetical protein
MKMNKSELFFWKAVMTVLALVFRIGFGFKAKVGPPDKDSPLGSLIVTNVTKK